MKRISKIISLGNSGDFKKKALLWAQKFDDVVLLEGNTSSQITIQPYSEFDTILAVGAKANLSTSFENAFEKLKSFQNKNKDYLFGHLSYDLKNDVEELSSSHEDKIGFEDLYFFQPLRLLIWKNNEVEFLYLDEVGDYIDSDFQEIENYLVEYHLPTDRPFIHSKISRESYYERVGNILDHIHRGDIYEVNFCQEFFASETDIEPVSVFEKLNSISMAPFACFVKQDDKFLLCSSPERFVKKTGSKIIAQPIKGTARRTTSPAEDQILAKELSEDPKERAENIMIVDLIRNDLSRGAQKGSVKVEELCKVYSFQQVHQLISTVTALAEPHLHPVDIIKNLFPMGSMTGAPKISAMKIIEEEEASKRGLYSGAVGFFDPKGNFDFNVVIRSLLYNASKKYVSFSVGSAITSKSVIEKEFEECLLKAKALREALGA
ncbi:anthranilate synthase component I family protein [Lutimonas zeaxanthinifaciens]|uniref:anthranilate synthase component I family protein n=1 Tax=Lutimonas zeaxanthinifaciens TaxID=3060215 RepID=UPI00265D2090|nr:anthranilate synthase component I family protein [Lutimonas sp. YSD2104]WKK65513.1 anthranilate synthase component I family protein [Lutimonas sp. YSD2104]